MTTRESRLKASLTLLSVEVTGRSLELPFLTNARDEVLPEGPFNPRSGDAPFTVDAATIEEGEVTAPLPPPMS